MGRFFIRIFTICALLISAMMQLFAESNTATAPHSVVLGSVVDAATSEVVVGATVVIDENISKADITDGSGRFKLRGGKDEQQITISFIGYDTYNEVLAAGRDFNKEPIIVKMIPSATDIEQVVVRGESASTKVNKLAFSVQSLSMDALKNSSSNLTDALSRMGGVKIRESGGLGSDTNISLNGFSGNHVKIFIDGIQLDTNNSAFSLSNMPANFAERIDVYSGVVPIEFGTDAIGGVINIVTNKDLKYRALNIDASYSYGSFNTHSTYFNVGQVFENGLTYNINLYQNYSDNDYWVNADVWTLTEGVNGMLPSMSYNPDAVGVRVRRFNDSYHNETAIATLGIANKSWADMLTLKLNYSQFNNDVQTGTIQDHRVYGQKEKYGYSFTPTAEYVITDMGVEGLDFRASASYANGYTRNYDPGGRSYNWYGEWVTNSAISPTDSEMINNSYSANAILKYRFLEQHEFTFASTLNSASRLSRSIDTTTLKYDEWSDPLVNLKNIAGLSYRFNISDKFDATAFGKNYWQLNEGDVYDDSTYEYVWTSVRNNKWGYGAAATYFPTRGAQVKLSYEKAYRLPTTTEVLGDGDLEIGTFDLQPEKSDNVNLNLIYSREFGKHHITFDVNLIYRFTDDYIQRSTSSSIYETTAGYENFGKVETKGYTVTARYGYDRYFNLGGTFNNIEARNKEENLISSNSTFKDITYGVRLPNTPYLYANADAEVDLSQILNSTSNFFKSNNFSITYDLFYQHEFPLEWEVLGDPDTKAKVPTQLSHNLALNYSFKNNRYNISFEVRNLTDAKLYDNYSLQKAGRAFYGKFRIAINKSKVVKE